MLFLAALLLAILVLSACAAPAPSPTSTPLPSATPLPPSATPLPSATATLTPSPSLTPLPTDTPTITPTPTPAADFTKIQILAVDSVVGGVRLTIALPGVSVAYKIQVRGYDYTCQIDPKYPDRLFCMGLATQPVGQMPLVVFDPQGGAKVYEGQIAYAGLGPAPPVGQPTDKCPVRGVDGNCETECRLLPDGSACIVATCTDSCGLYLSIASCPQNMDPDFSSCPPDLFDKMKAKYHIP